MSIDTIPIRILELREDLNYPAGIDDIRAVMELLPAGMLDGLTEVRLSLGMDECESSVMDDLDRDWDPIYRRQGTELLPGIWVGASLGSYRQQPPAIELYGYVYTPKRIQAEPIDTYCRFHMLRTFVHLVAHHCNAMPKFARSRWALPYESTEDFSDDLMRELVQDVVAPVLRERYPQEVATLLAWIKHHGGIDWPFGMLVSSWRFYGDSDDIPDEFGIGEFAFNLLASEVLEGEDHLSTRIEFARELHYNEHYHEALLALESSLAEAPDYNRALTLKADILVHQEHYAQAMDVVSGVLASHPEDLDARQVQADINLHWRNWAEVLSTADRGLALADDNDYYFHVFLECSILAMTALRQFEALWALFDARGLDPWSGRLADLCCVALLASGQYEETLKRAREVLSTARGSYTRRLLQAVIHAASAALGLMPLESPENFKDMVSNFRRRGMDDLADRIQALVV